MANIISKYALVALLALLNIYHFGPNDNIVPILITVAVCGFLEYLHSNWIKIAVSMAYAVCCVFFPPLIYFFPAVAYEFLLTKYQPFTILFLIPLFLNRSEFSELQIILLIVIWICSFILKSWNNKVQEMKNNLNKQRDDMTEQSIRMQSRIDELTSQQDSECNLAALNERNRIAREIHDNVGHLLSSSILQIGAIMAITKEENTKQSLAIVKQTLDEGMNSIRKSVHNLNNESIDLYDNLKRIVDEFKFCEIEFTYKYLNDPPASVKYAEIAIVKEALANVIKHSNATTVSVSLHEHPSIYQLVIQDNGSNFKSKPSGMGLENIRQRVDNLKGIVNFETKGGFKIFISLNKQFLED